MTAINRIRAFTEQQMWFFVEPNGTPRPLNRRGVFHTMAGLLSDEACRAGVLPVLVRHRVMYGLVCWSGTIRIPITGDVEFRGTVRIATDEECIRYCRLGYPQ